MAKNEVANKASGGALAVIDFAADAGMGMEGMTSQDMAIPFFNILQKLSPQLDTIPDAKAGQIFNTVTEELFKEIVVIPCAYKREFVEWKPRSAGGGLVGQHSITAPIVTESKMVDGKLTTPTGNILVETAYHFVIRIDDEAGVFEPGLITMSSTQLKKNRRWNSLMNNLKVQGPNGPVTPARFSHIYKLGSIAEQNDKGGWSGWTIDIVGPVASTALYQAARDFAQQVMAGQVKTSAPEAEQSETHNAF
jgi:hypothetical protein